MDVSIIVPTYNEADNMRPLISGIYQHLSPTQTEFEIIIVDDASPDQTADVAEALSPDYPVRVIRRQGIRGLSAAVIEGINDSKATFCILMDADLSHPITQLSPMIEILNSGDVDLVIGSRHIKGGGSTDWPFSRKLISWVAGTLAIGLTRMSDPTSGFMGIKRSLFQSLSLNPIGWKIVLETVVKSQVPFKEIPIVFKDRIHGQSKLSIIQNPMVILSYIRHIIQLHIYLLQR